MSPTSELNQKSAPPWESPEWQEAVRQTPALKPFFDNLESFVELPKGVKKLRKLIMELAVAGKLLDQNESDEPASRLLERIAARRAELIESKVIRAKTPIREKKLPETKLPQGWVWAKFADISFNRDGDRVPVRKADRESQAKTYDYYGASGVIDKVADYIFDQPLLLIGEDGANLINRSTPIAFIAEGKYWVNNHAHAIDLISRDMMDYVALFINSISLEAYITGMAQPKMNQARMNSIPVAIPPEAEQCRIVSKVGGLMSLCDTLEDYRRARMSVRERASRSVLASLTSSPRSEERGSEEGRSQEGRSLERSEDRERFSADSTDKKTSPASQRLTQPVATGKASQPHSASGGDGVSTAETLASSWQRLSDHFEVLLDQPETVPHLRQAILQLAVQGKLVRQDPTDEPASELIERISRQKASRVEAKEIPKPRPTEPINGEVPYELDESWIWTRLGVVSQYIESGWSPKCESHPRNGDDWGVLKISAVTWGVFKPEENKALPVGMDARPRCEVKVGDFLMSRANTAELVARSVVVDETPPSLMMNDKLLRVIFPSDVSAHYMNLFNNSLGSRAYYESVASGTSVSMRNVSRDNVGNLPVALPPLAEQKRIVSKVSVLLSQCDELSARLRSRQSTTDALLTALIHQILEGTK